MPHTPSTGTPITARIRDVETRHEHALEKAITDLRRERAEQDHRRQHESEANHRIATARSASLEELVREELKKISAKIDENTRLTNQILLQAVKTNGRVDALEKVCGDEKSGLCGEVATLKTAKTRALQTIAILTTIGGVLWVAWGDEIKARGLLNRPAAELRDIVERKVAERVKPEALKPNP